MLSNFFSRILNVFILLTVSLIFLFFITKKIYTKNTKKTEIINTNIQNVIDFDDDTIVYIRREIYNGNRDNIVEDDIPRLRINNEGIFPLIQRADYINGPLQWMTNRLGEIIGVNGRSFVDGLINEMETNGYLDTQIEDNGNIRNDGQNVHDSGVQSSIRNAVENLNNVVKNKLNNTVFDVIETISISDTLPRKVIDDSTDSLNYMINNNVNIVNVNMKELEILDLVWSRIQESEKKEDLIISLAYQLQDMKKDKDEFQCATGRANRLLNALNGIDSPDIVNIKPKWAINREMLDKAGLLRDKITKDIALERNISEGEVEDLEEYDSLMNSKLIDSYSDEYEGIVDKKIIENIVNSWTS